MKLNQVISAIAVITLSTTFPSSAQGSFPTPQIWIPNLHSQYGFVRTAVDLTCDPGRLYTVLLFSREIHGDLLDCLTTCNIVPNCKLAAFQNIANNATADPQIVSAKGTLSRCSLYSECTRTSPATGSVMYVQYELPPEQIRTMQHSSWDGIAPFTITDKKTSVSGIDNIKFQSSNDHELEPDQKSKVALAGDDDTAKASVGITPTELSGALIGCVAMTVLLLVFARKVKRTKSKGITWFRGQTLKLFFPKMYDDIAAEDSTVASKSEGSKGSRWTATTSETTDDGIEIRDAMFDQLCAQWEKNGGKLIGKSLSESTESSLNSEYTELAIQPLDYLQENKGDDTIVDSKSTITVTIIDHK